MRKILALVFICLTFSSCGLQNFNFVKKRFELRDYRDVVCKNSTQSFIFDSNRIFIETYVDGEIDTLIFDTGFSSAITKSSDKDSMIEDSCFRIGVVGVSKESEHLLAKLSLVQLENELFQIENETMIEKYLNRPQCINHLPPILGPDIVSYRSLFVLDFDNKEISIYDHDCDSINISKEGYSLVDSDFDMIGLISLLLTTDSVSLPFIFDTGAPSTIIDNKHYKKQEGDYSLEGLLIIDLSGDDVATKDHNLSYREIKVHDSLKTINCNVIYIDDINNNLLGMDIISKFNWIIDYDNEEVYCKPIKNQVSEEKQEENIFYGVAAKNNKLIVNLRNKKYTEFELGSVIKSVDGTLITEENICHYMETLNSADSWDEFEIEIAE